MKYTEIKIESVDNGFVGEKTFMRTDEEIANNNLRSYEYKRYVFKDWDDVMKFVEDNPLEKK